MGNKEILEAQAVLRVGEVHVNNEGYPVTIVAYRGNKDCDIQFESGTIIKSLIYKNIVEGRVKNPYQPSVLGVGYIGEGRHKTKVNKKTTVVYRAFFGMLKRCYSSEWHEKYPTYKDCTVDERWHNFQVFGDWFEENYNSFFTKEWEVDKDILFKGNKIYSPETCCFVPPDINVLLLLNKGIRGKYPIGVCFCKNNGKFKAGLKRKGIKSSHIGYYNTPEEAFQAYKIAKESYVKEVADKWRELITEQVYQALYNYKVEIGD